jgi:hypothetical protein
VQDKVYQVSLKKMSADNELREAITRIVALHQISQNSYDVAVNIEAMKEALFETINNMVNINRQVATAPETQRASRIQPAQRKRFAAVKVLSKKDLEENCVSECSICNDRPKYKNAILTECKHYYCRDCWNEWMHYSTTCPTCRMNVPRTTSFKGRAAPKKATQNPVIVIEDTDDDIEV